MKAWCDLSSLSINKAYLRPGITPDIDDGGTNGSYSARERSTVKVTSSINGSFCSNNRHEHSQMSVPGTGRCFSSFPSVPGADKVITEKFQWVNGIVRESVSRCTYSNVEKPLRNPTFPTEQLISGEACLSEFLKLSDSLFLLLFFAEKCVVNMFECYGIQFSTQCICAVILKFFSRSMSFERVGTVLDGSCNHL